MCEGYATFSPKPDESASDPLGVFQNHELDGHEASQYCGSQDGTQRAFYMFLP